MLLKIGDEQFIFGYQSEKSFRLSCTSLDVLIHFESRMMNEKLVQFIDEIAEWPGINDRFPRGFVGWQLGLCGFYKSAEG